jgi:glycosyltransferase involved in cell wall biosynthesis
VHMQAEKLRNAGKDIVVFTLNEEINTSLDVRNLGMPRSFFWRRIYRLIFPVDLIKLIKFLRQVRKFDLVISHLYPMNWLAFSAKRLYGIDYVYWYHGIPRPEIYPNLYERIYLRMFIKMTRITTKNADLVVSVSNSGRNEFKKYTGMESILIHNKPDSKRFCKEVSGSKIREKLNLKDEPVILNVGRVCPQKGTHLLIKAFKLVKQEIPNAHLVIIGKHTYSYYSKEIKELADNSVVFAGVVSDYELPQYYAMCDIYATCSLWESHNVPVLEAQACGKPVIAFSFDFFEEELDENDVLVEKEDVGKFAEACKKKLIEIRGKNIIHN